MARRTPNPHSPEEVRRAFQGLHFDTAIITEGAAGEILVGTGSGSAPTWTTELTTLTILTVDNITINGALITSDTGTVGFSDDNITTTGTVTGGTIVGINVTSGEDPGHTHTGASLSSIDISDDTNLAVTAPIVLTDDTLSLDQSGIDHGSIGGRDDDDHTIYVLADGTRAFSGTVAGVDPVADADLATKLYVDTAVESAQNEYEFEADSDMSIGMGGYISATDHADLAFANDDDAYQVIGLVKATVSSGETVTLITDGKLASDDWTAVTGAATLTPGSTYYLNVSYAASDTPDYANPGGTGDRTASIAITTNITYFGTITKLVDGVTNSTDFYWGGQAASGKYLRFDFGAGENKHITEAKMYQQYTSNHGTWKWQGSDNASDWTDIGSPFVLGGATTQTFAELAGCADGYRYYQLLGISDGMSNYPYIYEFEFKIDDFVDGIDPGQLTKTVGDIDDVAGSYIVPIGRAMDTTTMDIEIRTAVKTR